MPPFVQKLTKLTVAGVAAASLLAGCRAEQPAPGTKTQQGAEPAATIAYAGQGRDRLCLTEGGQRAGFITYAAAGDTNCAVRGSADGQAIRPDGDTACAIPFSREGATVILGDVGPACAYYCGPNASFAGRTFTQKADAGEAVDSAGDPLC